MTIGRIYMHNRAMDVCIVIEKIEYRSPQGYLNARVTWHSLGYTGQPWALNGDSIIIAKPDEWVDITNTFSVKRIAAGLP